jgi:hypothetical protein
MADRINVMGPEKRHHVPTSRIGSGVAEGEL